MRYVYEIADFADLTAVARDRLTDNAGGSFLAQFLPDRNVMSIEYRTINITRANHAASVRAFDTPAQVGRRGTIKDIRGKLPPISEIIPLSESEQITLATIHGGPNADIAGVLEDAIFDDVDTVVKAVYNRVELLRGELLATGTILLPELQQEVDYGVDPLNLLAAPTAWTNPAADKYGFLMTMQDRFVESAHGEEAGVMLLSRKAIQLMLADTKIRALTGGNVNAPVATLAAVNDALAVNGMPRIARYDKRVEDANGVSQRIIPENVAVFLPTGGGADGQAGSPIGETQWGITAEAGRFVRDGALTSDQAAGMVVGVMEEDNPPTDSTLGTGVALPVLSRPDALVSATLW